MQHAKRRLTTSLLALALPLTAQTSVADPARPAAAIPDDAYFVPIHTMAADPVGGAYGWWAGAKGYKASFHDGFTFYPYLGPDQPRNLPLAWRDTRVRAGTSTLVEGGSVPVPAHTDWRYEYRYRGVTEVYDVRPDGVEQTFRIDRRPATPGDLVVSGSIVTELVAEPVVSVHGELLFRDRTGQPRVRYGKAMAIDAEGLLFPVATSFDGSMVSLTVEASVVAEATFPLTIDPLTSAVLVESSNQARSACAVHAISIGLNPQERFVCTFFARAFSATDFDGFAIEMPHTFSSTGRATVFADITAGWSTSEGDVNACLGRWIVCFQRDIVAPNLRSTITTYAHTFKSAATNSGSLLTVAAASGVTFRHPRIGGIADPNDSSFSFPVLVVFQKDVTSSQANTRNSEVVGQRIHTFTSGALALVGAQLTLDTLPVDVNRDREHPAVTRTISTNSSSPFGFWAVVWQERDYRTAGSLWRIRCAFVDHTGFTTGSVSGANSLGDPAAPVHQTRPRVDGELGFSPFRFLATYLTGAPDDASAAGTAIETHRFDFQWKFPLIRTSLDRRILATAPFALLSRASVAYDDSAGSHWGIVHQRGPAPTTQVLAHRVGSTGGVVEAATVYTSTTTSGFDPAVAFVRPTLFPVGGNGTWAIVFATNETSSPNALYGRHLSYQAALTVKFGLGGGGLIFANRVPNSGDSKFGVSMSGGPAYGAALLLLGAAPASIPLYGLGMGPCYLNVGSIVLTVPATLDAAGSTWINLPLPDEPAFFGDLYCQWFFLDSSVPWPFKGVTTEGMKCEIR